MDPRPFHYRHRSCSGDRCRLFHLYVRLALRRWHFLAGSDVAVNAEIDYWARLLHLLPPPYHRSLSSLFQVERTPFRDQGRSGPGGRLLLGHSLFGYTHDIADDVYSQLYLTLYHAESLLSRALSWTERLSFSTLIQSVTKSRNKSPNAAEYKAKRRMLDVSGLVQSDGGKQLTEDSNEMLTKPLIQFGQQATGIFWCPDHDGKRLEREIGLSPLFTR